MSFWQSVKAWLATEKTEAKDAKGRLEGRLSSELDRRERILDETPSEAVARLQSEIDEGQSDLDAIGDRIGHTGAKADAVAEMAESDDVLDLPSEEVEPPER